MSGYMQVDRELIHRSSDQQCFFLGESNVENPDLPVLNLLCLSNEWCVEALPVLSV